MTTKPLPVYWDSCVFIDCIQHERSRYPDLSAILRQAESGEIILVASALALAEVVKLNASPLPLVDQAKLIREFFENDLIEIKSVNRGIAEQAAELCRDYGIKPADAVHVATALRWKCRCLQTYDGDKGTRQGSRKYLLDLDGKIGWPPLSIQLPKPLAGTQRAFL